VKVLLWTRSGGKYDWKSEPCELARVPAVGEYVAVGPDAVWYQVQLVVHMTGSQDHAAEAYAMEANRDQAKLRAFRGVS